MGWFLDYGERIMLTSITSQAPWAVVQQATFYIIALAMVIGAVLVVTLKNIFHCALSLALVAIGAAGIYFILDSEFLAIVQIFVYVGAVITLITFMVMLTQRVSGKKFKQSNNQKFLSLVISGGLLFLFFKKLPGVAWKTAPETDQLADVQTIGNALLTKYIFPFEIISVVLLAALIGAIVLARRENK